MTAATATRRHEALLSKGEVTVKAIHVEFPDKLAAEIEAYVRAGWFGSEAEVIRVAVADFVRRRRMEVLEGFMRDDIAWALKLKNPAS